jgi:hypothetical protein
MNTCFENLKLRSILFVCMSTDGFHNFWLPFVKKSKLKFLLDSMKSFTNRENPSI